MPEPPPRVLVAERSATIALFACALLHRWGYAAEPAATAQDVAAALAQGGFALVLAETGFFTGPASPALPWLALCSQAEAQAPAGAAGRVEKPLQAAALRAAVEHALRPAPAAPDIDLAEIVLNWDGPDDPNFRRVADVFLAWIVDQPDAMAAALAAGDRVALHREAHSICGAAPSVGCTAIALAARALEQCARHAPAEDLLPLMDTLRAAIDRGVPALRQLIGAT